MNWIKNSWLCFVSIIISAVAFYLSIRNDPFTVSIDSAILVSVATILSVPTAILIAWQIYQIYNIDKIVNRKTKIVAKELRNENARIFLDLLSCSISNSFESKQFDNAIILLSFIPEYLRHGGLQNDAEIIEKENKAINNVLDEIEKENYIITEESYNRFIKAFEGLPLFDLSLQRLIHIHKGNVL